MAIKTLIIGDKNYKVSVNKSKDLFNIEINSKKFIAKIINWNPQIRILVFKIQEKLYKSKVSANLITLFSISNTHSYEIKTAKKASFQKKNLASTKTTLQAPLAGRVIKSHVAQNQFVKKNQQLLTIESMKMENEIRAEADAFIKTISISEGDLVQPNQELMTFEFEKREDDEKTQTQ